jgi:multidrug efflux pump
VQAIARQVEAKVRENPHVMNVNLDWSEPSKVVRLVIDQERARALGVSSAQVSQFLSSSLAGQSVSVYREGNRQIEMLRGPADERNQLELLSSLSMPTANGGSITLSQVATMEYGFEDGIIWHRNRLPTVTVRADISDGMQALDVVHQMCPRWMASVPSCPAATCWKPAVPWRIRRVARTRSRPACRCSWWWWPRC